MSTKHVFSTILIFCVFFAILFAMFYSMQWGSSNLDTLFFWKNLPNGKNMFLSSLLDTNRVLIDKEHNLYRNQDIDELSLSAESSITAASFEDGKKIVLFSKDANKKFPVASLTKLMTAIVAVENFNLAEEVIISEKSVAIDEGRGKLQAGQALNVRNLLYLMLIESSNGAAYALSKITGEQKFVNLMNSKAAELGFKDTHFADATGLSPQSYSTSQDLMNLGDSIARNYPFIKQIMGTKEVDLYLDDGGFHHTLQNTNELLGEDANVILGKTGETKQAKGCLLLVSKSPNDNIYLISVLLGSSDRFNEMKEIISWVKNGYTWR